MARAMLKPDVVWILYASVTSRHQDSILRTLGERLVRDARVRPVLPREDRPACRAMPLMSNNALFMPNAVYASATRPNALLRAG